MKQQTAVEFLMDKLFDPTFDKDKQIKWFEQAKEMEKQQIIDAHCDGASYVNENTVKISEQYYNDTFKKE